MKIAIAYPLLIGVTLLSACRTDPEQAANKLFVVTVPLWDQHAALDENDPAKYRERLNLLTTVGGNLDKIVKDYPESSLAVNLVSTGSAGRIKRAEVDRIIALAERDIECETNISVACVAHQAIRKHAGSDMGEWSGLLVFKGDIDGALDAARDIENDQTRSNILRNIARAQLRAGHTRAAQITLARASQSARKIDNGGEHDAMLESIAEMQAQADDFFGSLDTVSAMWKDSYRSGVGFEIIRKQAQAGKIDDIVEMVGGDDDAKLGSKDADLRSMLLSTLRGHR